MSVSPAKVFLYAATEPDYRIALAASGIAGVSAGHVTGDFEDAWRKAADGGYLVIAVGGYANSSLSYNPCGWANPAGQAGGSTPFVMAGVPQSTLPGRNYYLNAAGETGADTLKRAAMLTYFAVHGAYPPGYGSDLPAPAAPDDHCNGLMNPAVSCPC
jgi:hypothetical protein